jgi:hypothetical protein
VSYTQVKFIYLFILLIIFCLMRLFQCHLNIFIDIIFCFMRLFQFSYNSFMQQTNSFLCCTKYHCAGIIAIGDGPFSIVQIEKPGFSLCQGKGFFSLLHHYINTSFEFYGDSYVMGTGGCLQNCTSARAWS